MTQSINGFMAKLPEDMVREIFHFIIPDSTQILFKQWYSSAQYNYNYSPKYHSAFQGEKRICNKKREYLCRINKKNGKHRYYITKECEIRTCKGCGDEGCTSRGCRGGFDYEYYYSSKYVGKNINKALLELFIED
jgi:hypothetical protein